jgi:hypothetical protein
MKKFLIEEIEKNKILSMHKALMNEQKISLEEQDVKAGINSQEDILRKSVQAGCLRNGKILTNADRSKFVYRATTKSGKEVEFLSDMTYKFRDGSKSGRWDCPQLSNLDASQAAAQQTAADIESKIQSEIKKGWKKLETLKSEGVDLTTLDKVFDKIVIGNVALFRPKGYSTTFTSGTSTVDFNNDQQSFVDTFIAKGYKLNPTRLEQNSLVKVTGEQLGAPADLFPNGLVMWYDPNQQSTIRGGENSILSDILDNQSINRTTCRKNVKDFFELYRRRNSAQVDPATVDRAKRIVQACRDEHYGKWGVTGGKNVDDMLDVLSGRKEGGPLSTGPTAIFRIK